MPLEVGLIGCGRVAELIYLPVLSRQKEINLVAVADPIRERRELLSSRIPRCETFSSAESLLENMNITAVIITTPPDTHVPLAVLALRAGLPTLVEKPLALSTNGIEELTELEASSSGFVMVGFNRRHWEPVRSLKQKMSDRLLSDNIYVEMVMKSDINSWSPVCGFIDPIDDLGSHQFDLLHYIFDCQILSLKARRFDTQSVKMHIKLEDDVQADCQVEYSSKSQESITVQRGRSRYNIRLGSDRLQPAGGFVRYLYDLSEAAIRRLCGFPSSLALSYDRQLMSFTNYIHTETTPKPGIMEGVAAIRAVQAARKSIENDGMEVTI